MHDTIFCSSGCGKKALENSFNRIAESYNIPKPNPNEPEGYILDYGRFCESPIFEVHYSIFSNYECRTSNDESGIVF